MNAAPAPKINKWPSLIGWSLVGLVALASIAVLAISRGEHVSALWMVVASVCVFALAYRFHSAWLLAKVLTIDETRATPAEVRADGKDYVPTNKWIVFGHHFAAIAGPGPLVGPVLAAQFGFLPGMLWMLIGATLGGAVHDCVILFCSIRRGGKSLGQMVREEIGPVAGLLALISIVAIMVILLAVLGLVVVKALAESPWGLFTILASVPIAMFMGIALHMGKLHIGPVSAIGVVALLASVWAGQFIKGSPLEPWLTLTGPNLAWGIIGYGLLASVLPVWLLLAPRDYLSTFMKIGAVAVLGVAIVILAPPLQMPAITKFIDGSGPVVAGTVFPFCFITIACAAVSGFHSLISSGTTPKLLTREKDIRLVGYGAMITEMLVGIMALIAACAMPPGEYFAINMKEVPGKPPVVQRVSEMGFPVTAPQMEALAKDMGEEKLIGRTGGAPTFAVGMANMFAGVVGSKGALSLWYHFAIMFEALFILTTIDAGTRVGRFLVQDLLGYLWKPLGRTDWVVGNVIASVLFVAGWGYFLYMGVVDENGGINSLWPIFGVANQLLAVIALSLGATVLIKMGRVKYLWVVWAPLAWLLVVTMTAGWLKIFAADPRVGFLANAKVLQAKIAAAGASAQTTPEALAILKHQLSNCWVQTGVTGAFLVLVLLVFIACAWEWYQLLALRRPRALREEPYVALPTA
jgi:carbon starvation protein